MNSTNIAIEDKTLKNMVWAYLVLLIFEGALRKWFLPGLATPLLLVRDPIALWVLFKLWNRNMLPANPIMNSMLLLGSIGILTTMLAGHGNLPVALFGARPYLIHFPLIFAFGVLLNRADVEKMGKFLLYVCIGMTIVMGLQFFSPQSAWINRGVGGDTSGAGFSGALGYLRPSGTFSFANGITLFYGLTSCFIFYFWLKQGTVDRKLLVASTIALLAAIPFSISRGLFFYVAVTGLFVLFTIVRNPKFLGKILIAVFACFLVFILLNQIETFQTAMHVFMTRFENASASEGGLEGTLGERYLGGLLGAFSFNEEMPVFGFGLGILSNVGTMLLSGNIVKGVSEGEWSKGIYEMGIVMGVILIFIRLIFSFQMFLKCYKKLSSGDILPWILLSFFLLNIPQGNWSQPTSLGFSVIIGVFLIGSFNKLEEEE
ncbi:hypothetical protein [Pedobacter psychroterrae]|uniref:O-antigen ligase-like membrane protein n=1 Tax=Pedobacter psychroterrae TaxID=2530453 RepID=A0A4R0NUH9_9SPHI|nr:hypothetical protein [Pedobacter psychroterrae]TCD02674.1 hypothetical protein EZ437_01420 [Pedobacter psychroterrae]